VPIVRCAALAGLLACAPNARPPEGTGVNSSHEGPLVLRNGDNAVDLLGDGTPAQVFVAWRSNFNAHGYSTVAIYLRGKTDFDDSATSWLIVPRFGGPYDGDAGKEIFTTSEGADCTLGDVRIVQHAGSPADLIIARRELGKSFADSAATYFDYYKLAKNSDEVPGWPMYYFKFDRTVNARHEFCDVDLAFDQELHLGRRGASSTSAAH
jgi:hypothetical protein